MAISPGPETLRALDEAGRSLSDVWMIFLPTPLLYLIAIIAINDNWLIPKLLLRNKFAQYIIYASLVSFAASFLASLAEALIKIHFDFPNRFPIDSPTWLIEDSIANAFFLVLIMVGIALLRLYNKWEGDMEDERKMSGNLEKYIMNVRDCLNPKTIFEELHKISSAIHKNKEKASELIEELSIYLRQQLTELPAPPVLKERRYERSLFSRFTSFLVSRRFGTLRYVAFILILAFVSYTAYSYEQTVSPLESAIKATILFSFLAIISSIIILWLFNRYERKQDFSQYIRSILILLAIIVLPIIFSLVWVFRKVEDGATLPVILEAITICSGIVGICLYVFGLSALLFFQNWIRVQRHITLLRNETLRQEYLFLRKQINPHFLFNVLNNIEISVFDEPDLAYELLQNLIKLLEYQFEDSQRDKTTVKNETDFIASYLSLEQSRRDNFSYEIDTDEDAKYIQVPTLLFIPIIENAVKYSCQTDKMLNVKASFKVNGKWLILECSNPYNPFKVRKMNHHGIGLENIRRRLELIYDGKAKISSWQDDEIPVG